ncbi:Arylsulfatase [Pontiella desulfatans]|uniref:Arylsulfatase n=1 Tax=Pontiella desulfatans TaxID=2750659 RepID=A0A6C2U231_PONDE|nr:arylsulfatase [Pontiella desulfatans]SPS73882.1 sulfatase S1_15 [Kiritimatiellales bacterium]VGO13937.1 Arylsulfatase [Pontiella desulfatans]
MNKHIATGLLLLLALGAQAETVGYWRFEPGEELANSAAGTLTLEVNGDAKAVKGSSFLNPVLDAENRGMADTDRVGAFFTTPDHAVLNFGSAAFTIEGFISPSPRGFQTLAGQWGAKGEQSWRFWINEDNGRLSVNLTKDGTQTFAPRAFTPVKGAFVGGKNYYVAAVVEPADHRVTYYYQNLTDGGPLQSMKMEVSGFSALFDSSAPLRIGGNSHNEPARFDEVRLTKGALKKTELLVPPGPAALGEIMIPASGKKRTAKPNIVVFLADDLGTGCLNAYGADEQLVRTPRLNQLAKDGLLFTEAYAPGSVCTPTRYAMLTGRYAWRGRLKSGVVNPGDPLLIEEGRRTVAMMLQEQGYRTAHIGKWHLGYTRQNKVHNYAALESISPGPNDVGFHYHFGLPNNLDDFARVYFENDGIYGLRSRRTSPYSRSFYGGMYHGYDAPQRQREQVTQDLNDRARQWIRSSVEEYPEQPLFLYFAAAAVHHPIEPSAQFRGTSPIGAYGDFIQELDHSVGEVMDALAYAGELENTLFIFSSDNGSDAGHVGSPEFQAMDAGLKINGERKGDKHTIWEGGVRVPFIVRWPGQVQPGQVSDRLVSLADIYSTLQHIVTGKPVSGFDDAPDSFSFADEISRRKPVGPRREHAVLNNVHGIKALRMGNWKYIEGMNDEIGEWASKRVSKSEAEPALYQLDKDPMEQNNVIDQYPEMAERLKKQYQEIRENGSERKTAR